METIARQFATDQMCVVVRNGYFSFRWSQIFELCKIPKQEVVLKARAVGPGPTSPFAPPPLEEVVAAIREHKPGFVVCAHVETANGLLLPDSYVAGVGAAATEVGALFVLDGIASGAIWVDMKACHVDILLTAPQKVWSSTPCAALIMMGERALARLETTQSTSFVCDLKKWHQIMQAYVAGGHAYHATMPTDSLRSLSCAMLEAEAVGLETLRARQVELGARIRRELEARGFASVAAPGFQSPSVVVSFTADPDIKSGKKFAAIGYQVAAGVPLQIGEPASFLSFRLGLFGLEKLTHVDRTVALLVQALEKLST